MSTPTVVEILNKDLEMVGQIKSFYPLDSGGNILRYSKELSEFGQCHFKISSYDTLFTELGDVLQPHKYHLRVRRGDNVVWQGAIIENGARTKDYIDVVGAEYLFYLGKKLVHRTSPDVNGNSNIYRVFSSGTMADAVTAIMTETIADYAASNHILGGMTLGTIENPDYPPNTNDVNGNALTGPWQFSDNLSLTYDFHTILYILKSFGIYAYADFGLDNSLVFNFKKFFGNDRHYDVNFVWGKHGNAVDFNLPRLGQRMINDLTGIATDENGVILHYDQRDEAAVSTYGLMEGVAAYSDIKSQSVLNARLAAEIPIIGSPDEGAVNMILDERAYPLGAYDVGDIVNMQVNHTAVQYKQVRRVVGVTVTVHNTGRELTAVQTNKPLDWQFGTS